jgi:hypothetical protein
MCWRTEAQVAITDNERKGIMSTLFEALRNESAQERVQAAVAIGHEHPEGASAALVGQLAREKDVRAAAACCAALESIRDEHVVEPLKALLETCPDDQVWDITHTLGRLTGIDPLIPQGAEVLIFRKTWLQAIERGNKSVVTDQGDDSTFMRFSVDGGQGRIRFDYDPPPAGTVNWPRWGRSLFVGERALYNVGSTCGTCETMLNLVGWPEQSAFDRARSMALSMQDDANPSPEWIKEWSPILSELQTGHYLATSVSLPVERVTCANSSWMTLRQGLRAWEEDEDGPMEIDVSWPGTDHFQGPTFAGAMRSFWSVLPSQDLSKLRESQVEHYVEQIRQGKKPTVLALGWMEDRYVQAEWNERFVVLCVLDGHHKLEAYARCQQPAKIICLFYLENTWGPRSDPSGPLVDAIAQLSSEQGQMSADVVSDGRGRGGEL